MRKIILTLISAAALSLPINADAQSLSGNSKSAKMVNEFCQEKHWRNTDLISFCVRSQMEALTKLDRYLESEWQYESKDPEHPVGRMIKEAYRKGSTVVNGQPWADWSMVRFHFKHSMQDWLKLNGKSTDNLNNKL